MSVPFSNTKLRVPMGFRGILEGLSREVLREQPKDIIAFSAVYFENLIKYRQKTGIDYCEEAAKQEDNFYNGLNLKDAEMAQPDEKELVGTKEEEAALVIQTSFRRFEAKKKVDDIRNKKNSDSTPDDNAIPEATEKKYNQEEDEAALVIQTNFRRIEAKKRVDEIKSVRERTSSESNINAQQPDEIGQGSLQDFENRNEAATKIQAGFRGMNVRKKKSQNRTSSVDAIEKPTSTNANDDGNVEPDVNVEGDESKHDMTEEEQQNEAAAKIQAGFRGMNVRKQRKKSLESPKIDQIEQNKEFALNDTEMDVAVTEETVNDESQEVEFKNDVVKDENIDKLPGDTSVDSSHDKSEILQDVPATVEQITNPPQEMVTHETIDDTDIVNNEKEENVSDTVTNDVVTDSINDAEVTGPVEEPSAPEGGEIAVKKEDIISKASEVGVSEKVNEDNLDAESHVVTVGEVNTQNDNTQVLASVDEVTIKPSTSNDAVERVNETIVDAPIVNTNVENEVEHIQENLKDNDQVTESTDKENEPVLVQNEEPVTVNEENNNTTHQEDVLIDVESTDNAGSQEVQETDKEKSMIQENESEKTNEKKVEVIESVDDKGVTEPIVEPNDKVADSAENVDTTAVENQDETKDEKSNEENKNKQV